MANRAAGVAHGRLPMVVCPWSFANVFSSIPEEVEVCKECVLDDLLPRKGDTWRVEIGGSLIVLDERSVDGS